MYKPIQIDRENLTIMGVPFPDLETLNRTANAIGSNMFEGFEPTVNYITLIRDYVMNKITFLQFIEAAKNMTYV
ncbi:MAG: antitoxin VbhA family protein [Leptospirales bacterium]|nr:antitoxin VbhA family protein [Leptospirales bacterium]